MQAWVVSSYSGIEGLERRTLPAPPAPGPGQVLVRVRAASLNYRELLLLKGAYAQWCKPDFILGSDGAGEVAEVGAGVWRVKPGDRVALTFHPHWFGGPYTQSPAFLGRGGSVDGVLAQYACVSENELVHLPPHLSFEEGACLPCAAVTAWSALCANASLLPGQSVLVQGSGGVSVFALQLARLFGARVIATSSSDEKLAVLRRLGADELIDYRKTPRWSEEVLRATNGVGVDVVVEVGGAETFSQSVAATAQGGRISMVGLLSGVPAVDSNVFMRGLTLHTIRVGSREHFEQMNRAIAVNRLRPVIDKVFEFAAVPDALRRLESGQHVGKVVIRHGTGEAA
jgi:NADPH:quinone reductase-like Zn-dependent oxidoreductase